MEMSDTGKRQTMANGEAQSGHARDEASPFACKRCKSYPSLPRGGQPFWLSFLESCLHCPYHCPLREVQATPVPLHRISIAFRY